MVTSDLIENDEQFSWSVGNIALALFAKLGGVPWLIEVPDADDDLIIGVGRADIPRDDGVERLFGYALSFASNGYYEQVWAFKPAVTEEEYESGSERRWPSRSRRATRRWTGRRAGSCSTSGARPGRARSARSRRR